MAGRTVSEMSFHELSAQNKILVKWQNKKKSKINVFKRHICLHPGGGINCYRCITEYYCSRATVVIISPSELAEQCDRRCRWCSKNCGLATVRLLKHRAHRDHRSAQRSRQRQRNGRNGKQQKTAPLLAMGYPTPTKVLSLACVFKDDVCLSLLSEV